MSAATSGAPCDGCACQIGRKALILFCEFQKLGSFCRNWVRSAQCLSVDEPGATSAGRLASIVHGHPIAGATWLPSLGAHDAPFTKLGSSLVASYSLVKQHGP